MTPIVPDWPAPANVRALVTTRSGGTSAQPYDSLNLGAHVGDAPEAVADNRARLRARLPDEPVWLTQTHGIDVVRADAAAPGALGDAAVARAPGIVCAILTADCLPVLLCDRAGTVVGAAHAGWRGLAGGVVEAAIGALGVPPDEVLAWLGPAIGPASFEVGDEVRRAFTAHARAAAEAFRPADAPGKWWGDLYLLARQRLAAAGVRAIHGGGFDTCADAARFYSYRRDRHTGRFASLIWRSG